MKPPISAPSLDPRCVTPGIETHSTTTNLPPEGIYAGLDWIRCTGPESLHDRVQTLLRNEFGDQTEPMHGAKYFKSGCLWRPGVLLSWGHASKVLQVDIQGERLRLLSGDARVDLLSSLLQVGLKPTRLDGALDYIGQGEMICISATSSCLRGELCVLRKYSPNDEFTSDNMPTRRLLKLGSRESPVCGRIYDKGLEQGVAPAGYWERIEIEWKQDRAPQIAQLLSTNRRELPLVLAGAILGAIDFRVDNGRPELDRRPQSGWWARLLEGHSRLVRTTPAASDEQFPKWHRWLQIAAGRRIVEFAQRVDQPVEAVAAWLLKDLEPSERGGPVVDGFELAFNDSVSR